MTNPTTAKREAAKAAAAKYLQKRSQSIAAQVQNMFNDELIVFDRFVKHSYRINYGRDRSFAGM